MTAASDRGNSAAALADRFDIAELLRAALALHQAGRLAEAENSYRRILAAQPRHFDGLHLLGVVFSQRGEHAAAVRQIDAAIAVNPSAASAHNNRGVSLNALGRRDDALASFESAIALMPAYFDALLNRANTLRDLDRFEEAVLGYDQAILLNPQAADLFLKRGHALMALNRFEHAIDSYDRAIARAPDDRDAWLNRGIAQARLARFDEAVASYDNAISLNPDDADAFSNRGAALKALKRFHDAVASCDRAIAISPRLAAAFSNRGMALREMDRLEEALASYDAAISLRPDFGEAVSNRANVLVSLRRFDEAIAGYQQAVALNPDDAVALSNSGMVKLLIGRFDEGWTEYEARWRIGQMSASRRQFRQPQWTGDEDIGGKRLLLVPEQGLGDTIMAVRYVRQVVDRGATVILELPAVLRSLLDQAGRGCEIVTQGDALPEFDLYCPLLSLPRAFRTTLATVPPGVPYVAASASHVAAWRERFRSFRGPRIGLAWAGNPHHNNDLRRSVGLEKLLPLLAQMEASFISLQKDLRAGDAELLRSHPQLVDLGRDLASYEDTAAVISLLDLVISVDTSVAHVTGALGKPVWILLPHNPDWRWMLDREDSPWYPTARLFRQSVPGDWTGVIERVAAEIDRWASARAPGAA